MMCLVKHRDNFAFILMLLRGLMSWLSSFVTKNWLPPWSRVLAEKLIVTWLVKFPAFCRTQGFIIMFTRACHISHRSYVFYMPCPYNSAWFDYSNIFCKMFKLWSSLFCSLLQSPSISSLLGPSILFRTLFSNNLNLYSSLSVRDQISHQYKVLGKLRLSTH